MPDGVDVRDVLDDAPDMSDLAMVIVNVETADGHQYSFALEREDGLKMSMVYDVEDQDGDKEASIPARIAHRFQVAVELSG